METANVGLESLDEIIATAERGGAPCTIRTCDLLVRSQTLYPAELRARTREGLYTYGSQFDIISVMSVEDLHRPPETAVQCAILTISDTRSEANDTSGRAIRELLEAAGHHVTDQRIVRDEPADISLAVAGWAAQKDLRLIITTGGTGIARRDSSVEAIAALFSTELPGFGELFRMLSYQDIGPGAMLSRATAGIVHQSAVFVLPGSESAVRLAMTRLILPQAGHLARELEK